DGNRPDDMGFCFPEQVFFSQVDGYELIPENEAKIRNQMKLQAQLDMLNRYKVESIEVSVLQDRFYYLKDYDLGDVCSVSIDEIQQMFTARIVEVKEVHSDNKVDVEIVLG
ncbi:siphovirus ReqiPepy6 Gp37-like family protein, partial [Pseudomonas aeruginosa]|uniref:siphovirus ReqiPepy6 Gp37-like family protein n=1 Tax=Pseudomonas aeruginosa TaxID=287 RepID=UPI001E3BD3B1